MADVLDVAAHILHRCGALPSMKVHRLCFYAHGWHLAWDGVPLFKERIEAWANGPAIVLLYQAHHGQFVLDPATWGHGDPAALTADERESVDAVLDAYAHLSAHQLSQLTHRESPWQQARSGLAPMERGAAAIAVDAMREHFTAHAACAAPAP